MHAFLFAFCKKHPFKTGRLCLSYVEKFTSFFTPNYSESYAINKDARYLRENKNVRSTPLSYNTIKYA